MGGELGGRVVGFQLIILYLATNIRKPIVQLLTIWFHIGMFFTRVIKEVRVRILCKGPIRNETFHTPLWQRMLHYHE